jgi:hypothetical protein
VYKGYLKHKGKNDYPIALMRMRNIIGEWQFQNEIELLYQFCHPNLISLIGFVTKKMSKFSCVKMMTLLMALSMITYFQRIWNQCHGRKGVKYALELQKDFTTFTWSKALDFSP